MQKEFNRWNTLKQAIHQNGSSKFYHAREIWWCALVATVGFEQDGSGSEYRRPVIILKGLGSETCLIVPLTTSDKKHPMRLPVGLIGTKNASAVLSQIRVIDTRRLVRKIGYLEKSIFERIRKAARDML